MPDEERDVTVLRGDRGREHRRERRDRAVGEPEQGGLHGAQDDVTVIGSNALGHGRRELLTSACHRAHFPGLQV